MKISKHYRPNSIYQDRAGTRYTVLYLPVTKCYRMYRLQPDSSRIDNSAVTHDRWIRELKYIGPLPRAEEEDEKI